VLSGGVGGAISLTFGDHTYDYGETAYVSVTGEHLGYDFSHWHVDGNDAGTSTTIGIPMYGDHTVQPQWTQVQYIYVEDVIGGHTNHDGYTQGTGTMAITAIPDSGWHIEEWLVNDEHYADDDETVYVDYEYGGAWVEPVFEQDTPAYTHVYVTAYEEIYQYSVDAGVWIDDDYWDSTGYGTIDCYILADTTHTFEAEGTLGGGEGIWWSEVDGGFYDYGGYVEWYCEEGDLYITFVYCLAK
jgi:hypothetical protein